MRSPTAPLLRPWLEGPRAAGTMRWVPTIQQERGPCPTHGSLTDSLGCSLLARPGHTLNCAHPPRLCLSWCDMRTRTRAHMRAHIHCCEESWLLTEAPGPRPFNLGPTRPHGTFSRSVCIFLLYFKSCPRPGILERLFLGTTWPPRGLRMGSDPSEFSMLSLKSLLA